MVNQLKTEVGQCVLYTGISLFSPYQLLQKVGGERTLPQMIVSQHTKENSRLLLAYSFLMIIWLLEAFKIHFQFRFF